METVCMVLFNVFGSRLKIRLFSTLYFCIFKWDDCIDFPQQIIVTFFIWFYFFFFLNRTKNRVVCVAELLSFTFPKINLKHTNNHFPNSSL